MARFTRHFTTLDDPDPTPPGDSASNVGQAGTPPRTRLADTPNRTNPCCGGMPPEHLEHCHLVARTVDRRGSRYISPLGDQRERPVPCQDCQAPTFARDQLCDPCAITTRTRALTHLDRPAREALL